MRVLLLVDIQNDFCSGGSLAVKEGEMVVPVVNKAMEYFEIIVASQDWHPSNHLSFASQHSGKNIGEEIELEGTKQILWPNHCVQDTFGAELKSDLNLSKITKIFQKGIHRNIDSYSAFYDTNYKSATGMTDWLKEKSIRQLFVLGLATDYCVKFSVLDALKDGFQVFVIQDGCRAVNLNETDEQKAFAEMEQGGAKLILSKDINRYLKG